MTETDGLRTEVRRFLAGIDFEPRVDAWMTAVDREFSAALGARGWIGMTFPVEFGGHGRSAVERYVVVEELLAAGAPVAGHWFADRQIGPAIVRYGTTEQKQQFLPAITSGTCFFAIGMSEPGSGSDLASVATRAVDEGENWRLRGTKVWTSHANHADWVLVLARTADGAHSHHDGLSQLVVPLDAAGVTVRPIDGPDREPHFNEVFFDDVVVPKAMTLGTAGDGWQQVIGELAYERSGPERFLSNFLVLDAFSAMLAGNPNQTGNIALGRMCSELLALRCMSRRVAEILAEGGAPTVDSALVKQVGTSFDVSVIARVTDAFAGYDGVTASGGGRLGEYLRQARLFTPGYTLRGGTNEILQGIVAKALLR